MRKVAAPLAALLIAAALFGCGGGEDSTSTEASSPPASESPQPEAGGRDSSAEAKAGADANAKPGSKSAQRSDSAEAVAPAPPVEHDDSGGGAEQFINKGADSSIQESGAEASDSERDEAALALHGFLDSSAAGNWGSACFHLSRGTYEQVSLSYKLEVPCPQGLKALYGRVEAKALDEAAKADVGSFRVEGNRGFVLYHGAGDVDYQMPMTREGGEWKVAAIAGSPLL